MSSIRSETASCDAARVRERLAQALVECAVVEEPGERIGLRLVLEPGADLGVVQRERRGIAESLGELELVVVERRVLSEAVDVQRALDRVARDQRDRDQRLGLVFGCACDRHDARVEVRLVDSHRFAMLDAPACQALPERRRCRPGSCPPTCRAPRRGSAAAAARRPRRWSASRAGRAQQAHPRSGPAERPGSARRARGGTRPPGDDRTRRARSPWDVSECASSSTRRNGSA